MGGRGAGHRLRGRRQPHPGGDTRHPPGVTRPSSYFGLEPDPLRFRRWPQSHVLAHPSTLPPKSRPSHTNTKQCPILSSLVIPTPLTQGDARWHLHAPSMACRLGRFCSTPGWLRIAKASRTIIVSVGWVVLVWNICPARRRISMALCLMGLTSSWFVHSYAVSCQSDGVTLYPNRQLQRAQRTHICMYQQ